MVHGFQLFDIWQRHLMESGADFLDFQKSYKQAAGDKLLFPLLWLADELNYYRDCLMCKSCGCLLLKSSL
jgi:hypothetical protein